MKILESIRDYSYFKKPSVVLGIYLFVILLFAFLYWYLNISFSKGGELTQLCFFDSLYFSVVTITTLGYGDISPSNGLGKLLTGSEAVLGILILGLYLNSLSHKLAINYQDTLKEKESEMAIKLLYVPNWYEINQYHWHLKDTVESLSKVKLLQQPASDSTVAQLASFKDTVNAFNNTINIYNLKSLKEDKVKSITHLSKLLGMIDPVNHQKMLSHISILKSKELHVMTNRFIDNIETELANFSKTESKLSSTSAKLQHIWEWIIPEIESMKYVIQELNKITGIKDKINPDGSRYYG